MSITQHELSRLVSYDPLTGIFVRLFSNKKRYEGKIAGRLTRFGYIAVKFGNRAYQAHRLAWLYVHGEWPNGQIDHINLNRSDNRIANLRLANHSTNQMNIRAKRNGRKGVTVHRCGKFQTQIKRDGKNYYLGLFHSEEEASAAYQGAAKVSFGQFARSA